MEGFEVQSPVHDGGVSLKETDGVILYRVDEEGRVRSQQRKCRGKWVTLLEMNEQM